MTLFNSFSALFDKKTENESAEPGRFHDASSDAGSEGVSTDVSPTVDKTEESSFPTKSTQFNRSRTMGARGRFSASTRANTTSWDAKLQRGASRSSSVSGDGKKRHDLSKAAPAANVDSGADAENDWRTASRNTSQRFQFSGANSSFNTTGPNAAHFSDRSASPLRRVPSPPTAQSGRSILGDAPGRDSGNAKSFRTQPSIEFSPRLPQKGMLRKMSTQGLLGDHPGANNGIYEEVPLPEALSKSVLARQSTTRKLARQESCVSQISILGEPPAGTECIGNGDFSSFPRGMSLSSVSDAASPEDRLPSKTRSLRKSSMSKSAMLPPKQGSMSQSKPPLALKRGGSRSYLDQNCGGLPFQSTSISNLGRVCESSPGVQPMVRRVDSSRSNSLSSSRTDSSAERSNGRNNNGPSGPDGSIGFTRVRTCVAPVF